jgi:hypothetical protein
MAENSTFLLPGDIHIFCKDYEFVFYENFIVLMHEGCSTLVGCKLLIYSIMIGLKVRKQGDGLWAMGCGRWAVGDGQWVNFFYRSF